MGRNKIRVILNFTFRGYGVFRTTVLQTALERVLGKIRTHEGSPSFDFVKEYSKRKIPKRDCLIRAHLIYPSQRERDLYYGIRSTEEDSPSLRIHDSYIRYDGPKG